MGKLIESFVHQQENEWLPLSFPICLECSAYECSYLPYSGGVNRSIWVSVQSIRSLWAIIWESFPTGNHSVTWHIWIRVICCHVVSHHSLHISLHYIFHALHYSQEDWGNCVKNNIENTIWFLIMMQQEALNWNLRVIGFQLFLVMGLLIIGSNSAITGNTASDN